MRKQFRILPGQIDIRAGADIVGQYGLQKAGIKDHNFLNKKFVFLIEYLSFSEITKEHAAKLGHPDLESLIDDLKNTWTDTADDTPCTMIGYRSAEVADTPGMRAWLSWRAMVADAARTTTPAPAATFAIIQSATEAFFHDAVALDDIILMPGRDLSAWMSSATDRPLIVLGGGVDIICDWLASHGHDVVAHKGGLDKDSVAAVLAENPDREALLWARDAGTDALLNTMTALSCDRAVTVIGDDIVSETLSQVGARKYLARWMFPTLESVDDKAIGVLATYDGACATRLKKLPKPRTDDQAAHILKHISYGRPFRDAL